MPPSNLETLHDAPAAKPAAKSGLRRLTLACLGLLGTGALLTLAACPANLANPEDYAPAPLAVAGASGVDLPVPACMTTIIGASCGNVGCHGASAPQAGLDLVSANVSRRLINVAATHGGVAAPNGCVPGVKLIDSANPSASWLVQKLTDTKMCGFIMPVSLMPTLTSEQIACFTQYANDVAAAAKAMSGAQ
jgi:hypothetical protein